MSLQHSSSDELRRSHEDRTGSQDRLPRHPFRDEDDEQSARDDLDSAEYAAQQQGAIVSFAHDKRKVLRGVVRERGGAGRLLGREDGKSEADTLKVGFDCDKLGEAETFSRALFESHAIADLFHFELDGGARVGADPAKRRPGFFVAAFEGEPASGFFEGQDAETQDAGGQELETDGNLPLAGGGGEVFGDAVVNPVG